MAKKKETSNGPHKGVVFKVKLVRQTRAGYAPTGFANAADVFATMRPYFAKLTVEELWVLCVDVKNRVIGSAMISRGTIDATLAHPRDIFQVALGANAASIILVHNHPSGNPEPGDDDIELTERVSAAGTLMGVPLLDHLVIGCERYVSLAERGKI